MCLQEESCYTSHCLHHGDIDKSLLGLIQQLARIGKDIYFQPRLFFFFSDFIYRCYNPYFGIFCVIVGHQYKCCVF
jgi:hypothetical protein